MEIEEFPSSEKGIVTEDADNSTEIAVISAVQNTYVKKSGTVQAFLIQQGNMKIIKACKILERYVKKIRQT